MTAVLRFLVLVLVLVQAGLAQVCDWDRDADPNQGLDVRSLDAGARRLAVLRDVEHMDMEVCRRSCCVRPACQLALLGTPADDGTPECHLVRCLVDGRDVCVLEPSIQFQASRKRAQEPAVPPEVEETRKNRAEPDRAEPRGGERNDTNNIRCRLPMKVGSCRAAFPRFYYDATNQSCKSFIYGGCNANGNNFDSQDECQQTCNGVTGPVLPDESTPAPPPIAPKAARMLPVLNPSPGLSMAVEPEPSELVPTSPPASLPEVSAADFAARCEAEPEAGPCRASMLHWYYDSKTRTCQSFIYGGCRGNKNNYISEESCMEACTVTVVPSSRRGPAQPEDQTKDYKEHCTVASDAGPCRAAFPMFYFEPASGTCQSFIYGGCRGNKNKYDSAEECMVRCTGKQGSFEERGFTSCFFRPPASFLVITLAVIGALMLTAFILIVARRRKLLRCNRLPQRFSSVSDKEELLQEPDDQMSVESLSIQGNPKAGKA